MNTKAATKPVIKTNKAAKADAELAEVLRPGQSVELLKELHILTREGRLNQDSRRKLKQVYHLFQFIEQLLRELPEEGAGATLADHGAGKSYLGFIIYDLFFRARQGGNGHVYGIETRGELVEQRSKLGELNFQQSILRRDQVLQSQQERRRVDEPVGRDTAYKEFL